MTPPLQNPTSTQKPRRTDLKPDFVSGGNVLHFRRYFDKLRANNHYQKVRRLHALPAPVLLFMPDIVSEADHAYVYRRAENCLGKIVEYFMAIPAPLSDEGETILNERISAFNVEIWKEAPYGTTPHWQVILPRVDGHTLNRPARIAWDFNSPCESLMSMLALSMPDKVLLDYEKKFLNGRVQIVATTCDPSLPRRSQAARSG
ncbi:MAG: hypothetical protein WC787_01020 [Patescibacteria group bacterium]